MFDLFLSAVRSMGRKKMRAGMTVAGIAIGICSVILILSIGLSGQNAITQQMNSLGLKGLNIQSAVASASVGVLSDDDVQASLHVHGVQYAMPVIMQLGAASLRTIQKQALIWGIGSQARAMQTVHLLYGNMLSQADVKNHASVCLVEEAFAKAAYKRSNIVGKSVTVYVNSNSQDLTVKGVVSNGSGMFYNLVGSYIPSFIYTPYTTAGDLRGTSGYDQIAVQTLSNANLESVGQKIVSTLNANDSGETFTAVNLFKQRQQISNVLDIITLIISAVGGISLVVAGLGIMTVMTVSVSERVREIGIKKAVGAPKHAILLEFLMEALCLSLLGGIFGIAGGLALDYAAAHIMHLPFLVSTRAIVASAGLSVVEGIVFGVYPAVKAANLDPVDALRAE